MNLNLTKSCIALLSLFCFTTASAQLVKHERLLSFEEEQVPQYITSDAKSQLTISPLHFRDGLNSLSWQHKAGSTLTIQKNLHFEEVDPTGKDTYMSAFIVWVYNEKAVDDHIKFEFLKDGRTCSSFDMGANFTGWRGAWVCYERDMEGHPEVGMNAIRITAPKTEGRLFFDHLIPSTKVDARQQSPDNQLPFVNKGVTNHWLVIWEHSKWQPEIALTPLTEQHQQDIRKIEKRFRNLLYSPKKLTEKEMMGIRKKYDFYRIEKDGDHITGRPIYFVRHAEAYERMIPNWNKDFFTKKKVEMNDYFNLMKRIAIAYQNAVEPSDKDELRDKFLAMYENITDQGVAYGSCWGNIHHYGYSMRGLFVSYFLMKNVLRKAGYLEDAVKTLNWYAITNEVYPQPTVDGIDIDTFNTKLQGRFASILIMEDSPEKVQYLRSLNRWLEWGCHPALGLRGSFKKDGACFHHCNNYPAYAVGGLEGATQAIFLLSGTQFRLSEFAHQTVKNVLLTMRFYCNLKHWPLSMSGRHPNGHGKLIPVEYGTMALAGSPDGEEAIDKEMAQAYLRLVQYPTQATDKKAPDYLPKTTAFQEAKMKRRLERKGFQAEANPEGNLALGYGCVSVQRRENWSACVRGHSRYLWAAEHYLPANFYGRYLAHGSLQIMTAPSLEEQVTMQSSGWQEEGFDWNRFPGATSIHLPWKDLKAKVLNVDIYSGMEEMLYSDEAFAGGLSQGKENGNFGMKLHEHDKYNGTHRARKSYHFFDSTIVCLGSDIENLNEEYPTETTIFQLAATSPEKQTYWEQYTTDGQTFLDPNSVGYYVSENTLKDTKYTPLQLQKSVGERSTKETEGLWTSLIVEHGKAPKGARYEYVVFPHTTAKALKAFAKQPTYKVWQHDTNAHIVYSEPQKMTSYVLFETPKSLPEEGLVMAADTSCLVMVREEGKELLLTVSQPDLALYRGESDEAFDAEGKRIERSIYSRPWISNDSGEIPVTVTLKGKWKAKDLPQNCEIVKQTSQLTRLKFICRDAASFDVKLSR